MRLHEVTTGYNRLHEVTTGYMRLQQVKMRLQQVTTGYNIQIDPTHVSYKFLLIYLVINIGKSTTLKSILSVYGAAENILSSTSSSSSVVTLAAYTTIPIGTQ